MLLWIVQIEIDQMCHSIKMKHLPTRNACPNKQEMYSSMLLVYGSNRFNCFATNRVGHYRVNRMRPPSTKFVIG